MIVALSFDIFGWFTFLYSFFFFFNDTATTEIYTLSLHDALPIYSRCGRPHKRCPRASRQFLPVRSLRSEEHTSELQSPVHLVCRLLLEKKKQKRQINTALARHKHIKTISYASCQSLNTR